MIFYLKVSSKTKYHMLKFISCFLNLNFLSCSVSQINNYNQKKFVTVLKSPHVNKTAQEQFEFRHYNCQFLIHSPRPLFLLLVLKKLLRLMFSELKLELKVLLHRSSYSTELIDPNFFLIKFMKKANVSENTVVNGKKFLKYIQLFDAFGESHLKNLLLNIK